MSFFRRSKSDLLRSIVKDGYERQLRSTLADPERLKAVYSHRFWQQPDVEKLRDFCAVAAYSLDAPVSQLNLVTDREQRTITGYNDPENSIKVEFGLCQHIIGIGTEVHMNNLADFPYCNVPSTAARTGIKAYLGVPLIERTGLIIGALCVVDFKSRDWDASDITVLAQLAFAVMTMREANTI